MNRDRLIVALDLPTPQAALAADADHIVVGRPIKAAPDPRAAAPAVQEDISRGLEIRANSRLPG